MALRAGSCVDGIPVYGVNGVHMTTSTKQTAVGAVNTNGLDTRTNSVVAPISDGSGQEGPSNIALVTTATEARIDSRLLATQLGNKHRHLMALLDRYLDQLKSFGHVCFKNAHGDRKQGGGKAERFALLNEDQSYFLLNLSRNSVTVVILKVKLIRTFSDYRRAADLRRAEYLPSYHRLSDAIHMAAAGSPNEKHVHGNIARLLNKTVGIESGQRAVAPIPQLALMIVAQELAARAMQSAHDHHDGYQLVKESMLALAECTKLRVKHG